MLHERIGMIVSEDGQSVPWPHPVRRPQPSASASDLLPGDTLAPSPGGFIPAFVKGLSLEAIFDRILPRSRAKRRRPSALRAPQSHSALLEPRRAARQSSSQRPPHSKTPEQARLQSSSAASSSASPDPLRAAMRQAGKRKLPMLLVCHSGADARRSLPASAGSAAFPASSSTAMMRLPSIASPPRPSPMRGAAAVPPSSSANLAPLRPRSGQAHPPRPAPS